ncbi:cell division protein PerM [Kibdelosporangium aridum]|uniref:cell division protein PerM n=1 Tax=Kibdelosporangium aridum TaxID=2030 RepID=UPI00068F6479
MSLYPPDVEDDVDEPIRSRARVLLVAGIGPLFVGYAGVVVVLALVISVATKADVSTVSVLSAAMPGWLAAYQVPLRLDGHDLGALPLLPTLLIILLIGRAVTNAADRIEVDSARDTLPIIATVSATHAIAGGVLAEVTSSASLAAGLLVPAGVAALAAVIGLARQGYLDDVFDRVDELAVHGLWAGLIGLGTMIGVGTCLVLLGLGTSFTTAAGLFSPGIGDSVGMFLLSVAYLPNAVVGGMSFAAGPGVTIGQLTATPLYFTGGPLPGVPVLAALPETGAAWWPVFFLLPLGVGAFVGWILRDASEDPIARLRAVGAAAVVVAGGCLLLAIGAGGRLADGMFDPLSMHPWSLGLAMLLWIALPAATVAWWAGPRLVLVPSRGLLDDAIEAEAAAEAAEEPEDLTDSAEAQDAEEEPAEEQEAGPPAEPVAQDTDEQAEDNDESDLPEEIEK